MSDDYQGGSSLEALADNNDECSEFESVHPGNELESFTNLEMTKRVSTFEATWRHDDDDDFFDDNQTATKPKRARCVVRALNPVPVKESTNPIYPSIQKILGIPTRLSNRIPLGKPPPIISADGSISDFS
jgi:hypothetical protein